MPPLTRGHARSSQCPCENGEGIHSPADPVRVSPISCVKLGHGHERTALTSEKAAAPPIVIPAPPVVIPAPACRHSRPACRHSRVSGNPESSRRCPRPLPRHSRASGNLTSQTTSASAFPRRHSRASGNLTSQTTSASAFPRCHSRASGNLTSQTTSASAFPAVIPAQAGILRRRRRQRPRSPLSFPRKRESYVADDVSVRVPRCHSRASGNLTSQTPSAFV